MIEESYVSFDTAKMLKEAGFDCNCHKWHEQKEDKITEWEADASCNWNVNKNDFSRPTQALAARWLREVHGLHVYVLQTNLPLTEPQTDKWEWGYVIDKIDDPNLNETTCKMYFVSYEEAFEAGLQKAIKLTKK